MYCQALPFALCFFNMLKGNRSSIMSFSFFFPEQRSIINKGLVQTHVAVSLLQALYFFTSSPYGKKVRFEG